MCIQRIYVCMCVYVYMCVCVCGMSSNKATTQSDYLHEPQEVAVQCCCGEALINLQNR